MDARSSILAILLVAFLLPLTARAADAEKPSVAVLVETTAGGPTLAASIEAALEPRVSRVVRASEVRAAMQFIAVSRPVDDDGVATLRRELGVDAVVGITSKAAGDGAHFVMVRLIDDAGVTKRFTTATADEVPTEAARLIGELPLSSRTASPTPTSGPSRAGAARPATTPRVDEFESPGRTIVLTDPPLTELLKSDVLVLGTNGNYYKGTVVAATDAVLDLLDIGTRRTFTRGTIKTVKTIRPASIPVVATESIVVVLAKESVAGTVLEATERMLRIETGTGSSRRFDWGDVVRIEVPAQRRTSELLDPQEVGLTPVAIFQPKPPYPAKARNANQTGLVIVEITVDVTGTVVRAEIVRSSPLFDESALSTVKKWRYEPLMLEGKPIAWRSKVNLKFNLTDGPLPKKKIQFQENRPLEESRFALAGSKLISTTAGYSDSWTRYDVEGTKSRYETISLFVSLSYGFFAMDGVELSVSPYFQRYATQYSPNDWERDDALGLALGAARLFALSDSLFVGPHVSAGFFATSGIDDAAGPAFTVRQSGRTGTAGVVLRMPVGGSAVVSVLADYYIEAFDLDLKQGSASAGGAGSRSGFETSFSLGFWWPAR